MKKIYLAISALVLFSSVAQAVEVGDIMYNDKTTSSKANVSGKIPVGLVYWVNLTKDHGYVMQLGQPVADTWANAKNYCDKYATAGFNIGSWRLPDLPELVRMSKQTWNGVSDDKFKVLNAKLATITGFGEQLVSDWYHSHTNSSAGVMVYLSTGQVYTSTVGDSRRFRCMMPF